MTPGPSRSTAPPTSPSFLRAPQREPADLVIGRQLAEVDPRPGMTHLNILQRATAADGRRCGARKKDGEVGGAVEREGPGVTHLRSPRGWPRRPGRQPRR